MSVHDLLTKTQCWHYSLGVDDWAVSWNNLVEPMILPDRALDETFGRPDA